MHQSTDQMMQGMQYHMLVMWFVLIAFVLLVVSALVFFSRRVSADNLLIANVAAGANDPFLTSLDGTSRRPSTESTGAHDTIFILPDISHYTRFMTGNRFEFAHAQHIIFCLINAMIKAATKTVELSKLEGDAALFFVDARKKSNAVVGETVMDIFREFFREQKRLIASNMCPCRACRSIDELDLKIFVHRGQAARFKFRGSIDHFGVDVIILHRIMKNGVDSHRYVMVTDAAADSIRLPDGIDPVQVQENVTDVGTVRASVFEVNDTLAAELARTDETERSSKILETLRKLRENIKSILFAVRSTGQRAPMSNSG